MLGLSDKAISAYESARITPPIQTLNKVAEYLKKPLSYFVDEHEESYSLQTRFASLEQNFEVMKDKFEDIKKMMQVYLTSDEGKKKKKPSKDEVKGSGTPPELFS